MQLSASKFTLNESPANKIFIHLPMLRQLENTNKEDVNKLLNFAKQNHLKLSVIDDIKNTRNDYFLPGKPLSDAELSQLIENSRKSGIIRMDIAHSTIRNSFNAD